MSAYFRHIFKSLFSISKNNIPVPQRHNSCPMGHRLSWYFNFDRLIYFLFSTCIHFNYSSIAEQENKKIQFLNKICLMTPLPLKPESLLRGPYKSCILFEGFIYFCLEYALIFYLMSVKVKTKCKHWMYKHCMTILIPSLS